MHDWTTFTLRLFLHVPPERVFAAWTTGEGLASWFLREARFIADDGTERLPDASAEVGDQAVWNYYPDSTETQPVHAVEAPTRFRFGWPEGQTVEVTCESRAGGTFLVLTTTEIPDTDEGRAQWHLGCVEGWTFFLTNLKSVLEHGHDLRELNPERQRWKILNL